MLPVAEFSATRRSLLKLGVVGLCAGCSPAWGDQGQPLPKQVGDDARQAARTSNRFAVDLNKLLSEAKGNLFFSPGQYHCRTGDDAERRGRSDSARNATRVARSRRRCSVAGRDGQPVDDAQCKRRRKHTANGQSSVGGAKFSISPHLLATHRANV